MLEDDRGYAYVCAYMKGFLRVREKPSVYEVARHAGVSTATVSRVLAGYERGVPRPRDQVVTAAPGPGHGPGTRCSPRSPSSATCRAGRPGTWPHGARACSGCVFPTWTPRTAT